MTLTACQVFLQNFTAQVVEHHCRLPLHSNQSHWANHTHMEILRVFIPFRANRQPNRCLRFTMPHWELLRTNDTEKNDTEASLEPCLDGWTYNTSIFSSTIISEWDLVCDQKGLRDMAQSVLMAGVLIGAVVFGYLADRFGRRALLIWSYLQMGIAGTCVAFLPTFSCYCIFRFLTGMAISGVQLNTISLILEWMPPKGRTLAVCLPGHGFPLGQLLLAGVAYAIRDWRWLQFAITLPIFLFFFCSWFLPESARWLVLNNRSPEAVANLKKVAFVNGKQEEADKLTVEILEYHMKEASNVTTSTTILDLVRKPGMRRISCSLMFIWFSTSLGFYAMAMDLQGFGISVFLIQVFFGGIDIIAKQASITAMDCFGRRISLAICLISAGILIIANIFVPQEIQILRTVLATIGKGCLAAAFTCIGLFSSELYPTVIRQTGLGFLSMNARVGAIVAPVIQMLSNYSSFLPAMIYGGAAILAGLVVCTLMETRNIALVDTVEQVERRSRRTPLREEKEELPLTGKANDIFPKAT
ncbi:solute carrier family 22 member 6-A-like isoform X2 [Ambystoma mexicanum]